MCREVITFTDIVITIALRTKYEKIRKLMNGDEI